VSALPTIKISGVIPRRLLVFFVPGNAALFCGLGKLAFQPEIVISGSNDGASAKGDAAPGELHPEEFIGMDFPTQKAGFFDNFFHGNSGKQSFAHGFMLSSQDQYDYDTFIFVKIQGEFKNLTPCTGCFSRNCFNPLAIGHNYDKIISL